MPIIRFRKIQAREFPLYIEALAELRIEVFREFPYLYKGSAENEQRYLDTYLKSENFCLFAAFHDHKMVGATTCLPLIEEAPEVQQPFLEKGLLPEEYTYFGESVLLHPYRGLGIGKKFFLLREAQTILFNTPYATFCAVERSPDHPLRPAYHHFLDPLWAKLGYQKQEELQCRMEWEELPEGQRTSHVLSFWTKQI
jgi:hypothetical protein